MSWWRKRRPVWQAPSWDHDDPALVLARLWGCQELLHTLQETGSAAGTAPLQELELLIPRLAERYAELVGKEPPELAFRSPYTPDKQSP